MTPARLRGSKASWALWGSLALACGSQSGPTVSNEQVAQALSCTPNEPRACACPEGGSGVQACADSGSAYGPCQDCVQPTAPSAAPAAPATLELLPDTATRTNQQELDVEGSFAGDAGASSPTKAPAVDTSAPVPSEPRVGASCGVGLPLTCQPEAEKCCVRSLATDTCIAIDEPCGCDVRGCTTLEVRCDGPEDCDDGQVCCGTLMGFGYAEFSCRAGCAFGGTQRIACHEVDPECPSGTVCSNSQILTNVQVCIDPSTIEQ